ncbi:SAV_915 family protein [Streptomyces lincolnensis]|uniref:SAV_915 family protein n=1 Tax=Streptomyces lincolnensis TaxID=1915 RepID=UPI001CEF9894|nr:SAV_915 family protein [Streptomyces lincolnensis]
MEPTDRAAPPAVSAQAQEPRRSRLLDYVDVERPGRPGSPAYHTPVFVPAHLRHLDTDDASGTPTRIPFIAYELFAHPTDGTVALAFTTLGRLVAALGEAQPWVATSLGPLAEGVGELGVTVRLDPRIAPGPPNWRPADLAAYAREVA